MKLHQGQLNICAFNTEKFRPLIEIMEMLRILYQNLEKDTEYFNYNYLYKNAISKLIYLLKILRGNYIHKESKTMGDIEC